MENFMFFDSRTVTGAQLALFHSFLLGGNGTGVAQEEGYTPLEINEKQNMTITLSKGAMFIKGYLYENDSNLDLELDAADPTRDRIDRVVIELNREPNEKKIQAKVLKGTASAVPEPPELTRDDYIYQMSVAQIRVIAGKSFVENSQIKNEKHNPLVCGYSPLHNLLRGVQVDENGLVNLPNQSYFEVINNEVDIPVPDRTNVQLPLESSLIFDRQNEIVGNTFVPKTSGVYLFFGYVRFPNWSSGAGDFTSKTPDVQMYVNRNGEAITSLFARIPTHTRDNIFQGPGFYFLEAGDVIDFGVYVFDSPNDTEILDYRVMTTKLS
ncbi:hypothetical protein WAK64_20685 [Bacillus spongiae]|uniref:C1q domain-containing protein n=1 Tax=Bacillus spongiae TaxID=2683610 RepID=A0ABU8HJW7_9BACI